LGVSTDFDKMANILVATRQEIKITKILKSFLKEELYDVNSARTNVGILLAKNVGKEEIEKIVKVLMEDVEIEVKEVDNKEFYFSGLQTRKSQFLMEKVVNRLEGVKFDEFDKVLAERFASDGDIPGDELYVTALVFHMNRKKWKDIFKELNVEEDVFKRFKHAECDDTQDDEEMEGEEMNG